MNKYALTFSLLLATLIAGASINSLVQTQKTKPSAAKGEGNQTKPSPKPQTKPTIKPLPGSNTQAAGFDPKNVGRAPGKYAIKVRLKGFKNVNIYLADNFGDKQYFRDTCKLDATGTGVFTGSPKLQRGIYMIVFPRMDGYYEVPITDDQEFSFEADTTMDEMSVKVVGSPENEAFVAYQKVRAQNGKARYELDTAIRNAKGMGNESRYISLKENKDSLDARDLRFREGYMSKNPNHLLTKLFNAFKQIKIPANPNPLDSMYEYRYFRLHYWDNVDFSESGLIRAPQGLLTYKLNDYIDKVSFQDPDSLVQAVDLAIGKTLPYTETYKYFVQYLTNKFQERKIMCHDNVTIHLVTKYYCDTDAWWYDDTAQKRKMCEDARKAVPTLCGRQAPDLNMADTAGKMHRLYENLGRYTIVFFYDPTCSHCKEVIPKVNAVFQKHKANGIKVYAVSTENQYDEWRKMMRNRPELSEWINVCRVDRYYPWPYKKAEYNIVANPTMFILDENGKIIGKKIHEDQLEYFIEALLYEKGIIKTKPVPPKETKEDKNHSDAAPSGSSN